MFILPLPVILTSIKKKQVKLILKQKIRPCDFFSDMLLFFRLNYFLYVFAVDIIFNAIFLESVDETVEIKSKPSINDRCKIRFYDCNYFFQKQDKFSIFIAYILTL